MDGSYSCLASHRLTPPTQPPSRVDAAGTGAAGTESSSKGGGGGGGGAWSDAGCESISTVRGYAVVSQGPLLSVYNTTDGGSRLLFTRHAQEGSDPCGEGALLAAGREGSEDGGVAGGGVGEAVPAAGRRGWSVMSSAASGEVLVAEAPRCSAVGTELVGPFL